MADYYQVDLDALARMTSALQQAGDQMEQALRLMGGSEGAQIGTDELDRAANDFQSTWQYGLGQLRQSLSETDEGLKQAQSGYQQMEQALQQAFHQIGSQEVQPLAGQIDQLAPKTGGASTGGGR
ncbi:hypothetical protein [Streptacidiphilus melanogenes]|uniref:hypothetical protein n=1 Tax=Streptacidiphilus melanogenes TaxID=411235 RepID=UPI0005AAE5EB|nr:hypothetical protein [Streptacidiphilus melanogenes]